MNETVEKEESKQLNVLVCWPKKYIAEYDTRLLSSLAEVFKSSLFAKKPQESVSLYKCLEAFLKEEPLGPEDVVSGCILILLNLALKYFVLYTPMIWKS